MTTSFFERVAAMTDWEVMDCYRVETWQLKTLNRWRLRGSPCLRPCRHPNTTMMNVCKREPERRGLSVRSVEL